MTSGLHLCRDRAGQSMRSPSAKVTTGWKQAAHHPKNAAAKYRSISRFFPSTERGSVATPSGVIIRSRGSQVSRASVSRPRNVSGSERRYCMTSSQSSRSMSTEKPAFPLSLAATQVPGKTGESDCKGRVRKPQLRNLCRSYIVALAYAGEQFFLRQWPVLGAFHCGSVAAVRTKKSRLRDPTMHLLVVPQKSVQVRHHGPTATTQKVVHRSTAISCFPMNSV